MTLYHYHLLGLALTALSMSGFGIFLLLKNPRRNLNRSMALYCFSVAWWSGWECALLQMPTRELSEFLLRVEYIGVSFIPTLLCTTVSYLVNLPSRTRWRLLLPFYALSVIFFFVFTLHPMKSFLGMTPGPIFYLPIWGWAGPHYWTFLAFFFSGIAIAHTLIFYKWIRAQGEERAKLSLFTVGSIFAYLGGCPEFALKYGVRLGWLNPFGLYVFIIYIAMLTYAVLQYQFFDIHIVIRRSLVYSLLVSFLTIGYFALVYGIERLFQTTFGYQSIWLSLAAFALMALLFQPLKVGIQRLVDWLIFRSPHEELVKRMEKLEEQVLQAEKLKAVATLAAGVSHELKNPLQLVKTYGELLPENYDDPQFRKRCSEVINTEVGRMTELVRQLMYFARPKQAALQEAEAHSVLEGTLDSLKEQFSEKGAALEKKYGADGARVQVDSDQLRQVFWNLTMNALQAKEKGVRIVIKTWQEDGLFAFEISDNGPGIDPSILPKLFEPFVTTKPNGTGLGLSIVHSIVKEHRGEISVKSKPVTCPPKTGPIAMRVSG
ncbi:MAG: hypothetical protein HYZ73_01330 [Elusimicrobia bacterium]|nr:hypothetical protein [Elusimicrobiota bacterium]